MNQNITKTNAQPVRNDDFYHIDYIIHLYPCFYNVVSKND